MDELSPRDEADLAALADGRLDPSRRGDIEARIDADPELAAALERQRVALAIIDAAVDQTSAPLSLRSAIERQAAAQAQKPDRRAWWRGRRWFPVAGVAGLAAAAALALVVVLGGGGLTVQETLAAATRPPVATAAVGPVQGPLLRDEVDGVRFPNFGGKFGWRPTGARSDELDGRATRTVFYERGGRRIAYTIVGGEALDLPEGADPTTRDGVELRTFTGDGRQAVTWERSGRTCVLSGVGVDADTLLELAAWKGMGAVRF